MKVRSIIKLTAAILAFPALCWGASVNLAWDYTGPDTHTFKVHWGEQAQGPYPNSLDTGTAKTAKVEGLEPGKTYHFVATAHNAGLTSDPSNELMLGFPLAPIELRIVLTVPLGGGE